MGLPREARSIVVGSDQYRWLATPKQETVVSAALVGRFIEDALRKGWTPLASGGEFLVPAAVVKNLL